MLPTGLARKARGRPKADKKRHSKIPARTA
jgi:hypothetical protein